MHDWHSFFHHTPDYLNKDNYKVFEPAARAEILHWFGQADVPDPPKEAFIEALITFEDDCGNFYRYRAFLLAAEALAYAPQCQQGDTIVDQLLKYSYAYFQQAKHDWRTYPKPLTDAARATIPLTDRSRIIARFTQLLHTTERRAVLLHAAEQLGKLDPGNLTAIAALAGLIQVSHHVKMRLKAAQALMRLAPTHPLLLPTFIQLTQVDPEQQWIMRYAVGSLGDLETSHEAIVQALIKLMETDAPESICLSYIAAQALGNVGKGNEAAIAALIRLLLEKPLGSPEWLSAIKALEKIGKHHPIAIAAVLETLETHRYTNPDPSNLCNLAVCLLKIDPGNSIAITILAQLLQTRAELPSQWRTICWQAADSLTDIRQYHQLVVDTLLEVAQMVYYDYPPIPISDTLNKNELLRQLAISTLLQRLQNPHADDSVWREIALWHLGEELGCLGEGNAIVIDALTQFLVTAEDDSDRNYAAECLGRLDPGNITAIEILTKQVQTAEDTPSRLQALYSLGQIGIGNQAALETLVQFLQTFEDDGDNYEYVLRLATGWEKALQKTDLAQLVMALSHCMTEQVYQRRAYRYDTCYHLLWQCAQHLTYPDFYLAYAQFRQAAIVD